MHAKDFVIEMFIAVLQGGQSNMPANGVLVEHDRIKRALSLSLYIVVLRGQQAFKAEALAFLFRETRTFVVQGVTKQRSAAIWHLKLMSRCCFDQLKLVHVTVPLAFCQANIRAQAARCQAIASYAGVKELAGLL